MGTRLPLKAVQQPPSFRPMSTVTKPSPISATAEHLFMSVCNIPLFTLQCDAIHVKMPVHLTARICIIREAIGKISGTLQLTRSNYKVFEYYWNI